MMAETTALVLAVLCGLLLVMWLRARTRANTWQSIALDQGRVLDRLIRQGIDSVQREVADKLELKIDPALMLPAELVERVRQYNASVDEIKRRADALAREVKGT